MNTRASIANYDDDYNNHIIPLLCLGPNNFFAVTEPQPRYHGNEIDPNNRSTILPSKSGSIKEDGENDDHSDSSLMNNITTDTMIYNVMIKNIDDKNDSFSNDNHNNNKQTKNIVVGGHSKIITAIDWHKESQMLATCSVDGTLRIFEVFRH